MVLTTACALMASSSRLTERRAAVSTGTRLSASSLSGLWAYLKLGWESKCGFELGWRAESQMGLGEHPGYCGDGCRCVYSEEATGALRKGSGIGGPRGDFQGTLG